MTLVIDYHRAVECNDWRKQCLISSANVAWFIHSKIKTEVPMVYYNKIGSTEDFKNIATGKNFTKTIPIKFIDLIKEVPAMQFFSDLVKKESQSVFIFQFLETEPDKAPWYYQVSLDYLEAYGSIEIKDVFQSQVFNSIS